MSHKEKVKYKGVEFDVEFDSYEGQPEIMPYQQGLDDYLEITDVLHKEVSFMEFMDECDIEELERIIEGRENQF